MKYAFGHGLVQLGAGLLKTKRPLRYFRLLIDSLTPLIEVLMVDLTAVFLILFFSLCLCLLRADLWFAN